MSGPATKPLGVAKDSSLTKSFRAGSETKKNPSPLSQKQQSRKRKTKTPSTTDANDESTDVPNKLPKSIDHERPSPTHLFSYMDSDSESSSCDEDDDEYNAIYTNRRNSVGVTFDIDTATRDNNVKSFKKPSISIDQWPQYGESTLGLLNRLVSFFVTQPSADIPSNDYQKALSDNIESRHYNIIFHHRCRLHNYPNDMDENTKDAESDDQDTGLMLQLFQVRDTLETISRFLDRCVDINATLIGKTFEKAHQHGVLSPQTFRSQVVCGKTIHNEDYSTSKNTITSFIMPSCNDGVNSDDPSYDLCIRRSFGPCFTIGTNNGRHVNQNHGIRRSNLLTNSQKISNSPTSQIGHALLRDNQHSSLLIPSDPPTNTQIGKEVSVVPHRTLADVGSFISLLLFLIEQLMRYHPYSYGTIYENDIINHGKEMPSGGYGSNNNSAMDHQCGLWKVLVLYHRFISTHFVDIMTQTLALAVGNRDLTIHNKRSENQTIVEQSGRIVNIDTLNVFHQSDICYTPKWVSFRGIRYQRLLLSEGLAMSIANFAKNDKFFESSAVNFNAASKNYAVSISDLQQSTQIHIDVHRLLRNSPSYASFDQKISTSIHKQLLIDIFGPNNIHASSSDLQDASAVSTSNTWQKINALQEEKKRLIRSSVGTVTSNNYNLDIYGIDNWSSSFVGHYLSHIQDLHPVSCTLPIKTSLSTPETIVQILNEYAQYYESVPLKTMAYVDTLVHIYNKARFNKQTLELEERRITGEANGMQKGHFCEEKHAINTRMAPLHFYTQDEVPNMVIPYDACVQEQQHQMDKNTTETNYKIRLLMHNSSTLYASFSY